MSQDGWHIAVLIPARNEEELLPRCLRSVVASIRELPLGVTTDVIVASDHSGDRTHEIATEMLQGVGIAIHTNGHGVGSTRACAATAALGRNTGPYERCWLANTDADCEVPATWLLDHLAFATRGVPAVAGIIDVDSFLEHGFGVQERFRLTYRLHADGSHPHVHGANLGIRADAYLCSGGWGDLVTAEDHDLWRRVGKSGYSRVSAAALKVLTSGRREGRAPRGFAEALAVHNGTAA